MTDTNALQRAVDEGDELARRGEHEAAIARFSHAKALGADWVGLNIGNSLAALGRPDDAEREYEEAWRLGGSRDAAFNLALSLESRGDPRGRERYRDLIATGYAKAAINEAAGLQEEGRPDAAIALLEDAIRDPEVGDIAAAALGSLLFRLGRLDAAERALRQGARTDAGARADLGHLLMATGRVADAERIWRTGAAAGETESLLPLANLLADRGEREEADRLYREGASR